SELRSSVALLEEVEELLPDQAPDRILPRTARSRSCETLYWPSAALSQRPAGRPWGPWACLIHRLFDRVVVPQVVVRQLLRPRTPKAVREWMQSPPEWVE